MESSKRQYAIFKCIDNLYLSFRQDNALWPIERDDVKLIHVHGRQLVDIFVVLKSDLVIKFTKRKQRWISYRIDSLCYQRVTEFVLSSHFTVSNFALTEDGRVFHWFDSDKPCPIELQNEDHFYDVQKLVILTKKPAPRSFVVYKKDGTLVFFNEKNNKFCDFHIYNRLPPIKKLISGRDFIIGLSERASIYVYGFNNYGQLGSGTYSAHEPELMQVKEKMFDLLKIVDIAVGKKHTLMLTDQGEVYVLGMDEPTSVGICVKLKQLQMGTDEAEAIQAHKHLYSATIKGSNNPKRYVYWVGPSENTIGFDVTPNESACTVQFFKKLWVTHSYPHTLRLNDVLQDRQLDEKRLRRSLNNGKPNDLLVD